jgi:uncharacterized protein YegL
VAKNKPRVTSLVPQNQQSVVLTGELPPVVLNRQMRRAVASVLRKQIRLQLMLDLSGSFRQHETLLRNTVNWLVDELLKMPNVENVLLCITEMSGIVQSSGYLPVDKFIAVNLPAGSTSPFAAALGEMIKQNEGLSDDPEGALQIDVPIGDWFYSEDDDNVMAAALTAYQKHQKEHCGGTHVFPVCIGHSINTDVAKLVSIRYQPYTDKDVAFEAIFALILGLIKDVSQDVTSLQNRVSLDIKDLQKAGN